jgi:hypothetical protein
MIQKDGNCKYNCDDILNNINMKNDFDDSTFLMWKSEMQKELSNFWDLMNKK